MFNSVYLDTFSECLITLAQLERDYDECKRNGEIDDCDTFAEYLENCMHWNNGALYPVSDCVVRNDYPDSLRLTFADCVYIMLEQMRLSANDAERIYTEYGYELNRITRPELIELVNEYLNH